MEIWVVVLKNILYVVSESVCNISCNLYCLCCISIFLTYANLLHFFFLYDFLWFFLICFWYSNENKSTCATFVTSGKEKKVRLNIISFSFLWCTFPLPRTLIWYTIFVNIYFFSISWYYTHCVPLISVYCPYHHYAFYESTKLWYSINIVYRSLFIIHLVVFL